MTAFLTSLKSLWADFHNLTYDFCNYEWLIKHVFLTLMSWRDL